MEKSGDISKKQKLLDSLQQIDQYAKATKLYRFLKTPLRYSYGIFYREVIYRLRGKGKLVGARTFWGDKVSVLLPASLDIYLTGAKTHDSEIRLARFLILSLNDSEEILDIGAHFGYFSLLCAMLASKGKVIGIEASKANFNILAKNTAGKSNITILNLALSDDNSEMEFLEFPVIYSEYNTLIRDHYKDQTWFQSISPKKTLIRGMKGDDMIREQKFNPGYIKIDVEGAEDKVISGIENYLSKHSPVVIMEFGNSRMNNSNHVKAENQLKKLGYKAYKINFRGNTEDILNTTEYIESSGLDSDNIVYVKDSEN